MNGRLFAVCCILLVTACLWASVPSAAHAKTQLMSGGIQDVDPQTLKELLSTFEQAEQAMRAHDIDGIMALYSDDYLSRTQEGGHSEDLETALRLLQGAGEFSHLLGRSHGRTRQQTRR